MENTNPQISVIVPVYNAEKYLRRCVDSILAQTFTNFELLLIDDGSKDKSGEICDEYARKDNRVKVFHKENGGVSSARNVGLDNAQGEWICFCDADDWMLSTDTFDIPFYKLEQVDVIELPFTRNGEINNTSPHLLNGKHNIHRYYANNFHNEIWARLYNIRLLSKNRFITSLKIGEDVVFFLAMFKNIHNIYISSNGGYRYFRNCDSVMTKTDHNFEKLQIEEYLSFIDNLRISKDDIIGFYFNTAKYLWSIRKHFVIKNMSFIRYFTLGKIIRSKLTIRKKIEFVMLHYKYIY